MNLQCDCHRWGAARHARMRTIASMDDPVLTPDDLRTAWRDATHAAELAERLAGLAREAAQLTDANGLNADEIATLADAAAEAATRAASTARVAATEAADRARTVHFDGVPTAD